MQHSRERFLQIAQQYLQFSLSENGDYHYLNEIETYIKNHINASQSRCKSDAIIIFYPSNFYSNLCIRNFIDKILKQYDYMPLSDSSSRSYASSISNSLLSRVAFLSGFQCTNETALISLANQFISRDIHDIDSGNALIDLKAHFGQCKYEKQPAIIVLEDIQEFAHHGSTQMFLYTLFDLLHNSELLFMVFGLTSNSKLYSTFEKRISSRLISHFVTLPALTTDDVCIDLHSRLYLPTFECLPTDIKDNEWLWEEQAGIEEDEGVDDFPMSSMSRFDASQYNELRQYFNEQVDEIIGSTSLHNNDDDDTHGNDLVKEKEKEKEVEVKGDGDIGDIMAIIEADEVKAARTIAEGGESKAVSKVVMLTRGSLYERISLALMLGTHNLRDFKMAFTSAIEDLTPARVILRAEDIKSQLNSMVQTPLEYKVRGLCTMDLGVLCVVTRLEGRIHKANPLRTNNTAPQGGSGGASLAVSTKDDRKATDINVQDIIKEFIKLYPRVSSTANSNSTSSSSSSSSSSSRGSYSHSEISATDNDIKFSLFDLCHEHKLVVLSNGNGSSGTGKCMHKGSINLQTRVHLIPHLFTLQEIIRTGCRTPGTRGAGGDVTLDVAYRDGVTIFERIRRAATEPLQPIMHFTSSSSSSSSSL